MELPYNPAILEWARKRLRLAPEDVAHKASVSTTKIIAWEHGEASPTVRQARTLASIYDRPFLEFFAHAIPELAPLEIAPDYRFHRNPPSSLETTALEGVQAWAESQRLNALDLYQEIGEPPDEIPVALRASIANDPEDAADRARAIVGPSVEKQVSLKSIDRPKFPSMLRDAFERAGVLVLKQSGLAKTRTRGICLYNPILPTIVFGNESPGAQSFTLAHEFAHVALGESALSGGPRSTKVMGSAGKRIEAWCNSFAAAFLMPRAAILSQGNTPRHQIDEISDYDLKELSKRFAVSRHAMLVRLVSLGKVHPSYYWRVKRAQFIQEEEEYEGGGRSPYYGSRYRNSLGDKYTGLVIEALETGRIAPLTAAEFMGIKNVRHLVDIKEHFAK